MPAGKETMRNLKGIIRAIACLSMACTLFTCADSLVERVKQTQNDALNPMVTLVIQAGNGGTVDLAGNQTVKSGDKFNLTATPDPGNTFADWTQQGGPGVASFDDASSASTAVTQPATSAAASAVSKSVRARRASSRSEAATTGAASGR
jgi:hypothetical protein